MNNTHHHKPEPEEEQPPLIPDTPAEQSWLTGIAHIRRALRQKIPLNKIYIRAGTNLTQALQRLIHQARQSGIPIRYVPDAWFRTRRLSPYKIVAAQVAPIPYLTLQDLIKEWHSTGKAQLPALPPLLILDGITDPRNLGALIRTGVTMGARWFALPTKHSAAIDETVLHTSRGTLLHARLARFPSTTAAIHTLQQHNIPIIATTHHQNQTTPLTTFSWHEPCALILGSEDKGVSQAWLTAAQARISIPTAPWNTVLNVSVACGIFLYDWFHKAMKRTTTQPQHQTPPQCINGGTPGDNPMDSASS